MNTLAMNNEAKRIGDALDAAMKSFDGGKGISQAEVFRRTGVPQPTISRTLSGKSIPEVDTLTKLVGLFGVSIFGKTVAGILHGESSIEGQCVRIEDPQPLNVTKFVKPSEKDERIKEIIRLLQSTNMEGLAVMLDKAQDVAKLYPGQSKQTGSSSQ